MTEELNLRARLILGIFPVIIVLVLTALEIKLRQHIIFTSLVSSIFLIYLRPNELMTDTATILVSQFTAALTGYLSYKLFGNSFWSVCVTILLVTAILILLNRLHPPAIATSVIFNYRTHSESDLFLFGLLIGIAVVLILVRWITNYLLSKMNTADTK